MGWGRSERFRIELEILASAFRAIVPTIFSSEKFSFPPVGFAGAVARQPGAPALHGFMAHGLFCAGGLLRFHLLPFFLGQHAAKGGEFSGALEPFSSVHGDRVAVDVGGAVAD